MSNALKNQPPKKDDLKPNKLLGQNFLVDKNILKKIIDAANLSPDDLVLEVGPGTGVLTEGLVRHAGCVIAVEKDKSLAAALKVKFSGTKNLKIIEDDILEFIKQGEVTTEQDYRVIANIPYYLTSHLIRLLLESTNPPKEMILMIQKEVAQRICAAPPKMTLLAVATQFYAQPKIIASVSKNSFWPAPKVDSAIIKITPHQNFSGQVDPKIFFQVVRAGFAHPRKQLGGNLSGGLKIKKDQVSETLAKAKIKNSQRAETLTIEDWLKISKNLDF